MKRWLACLCLMMLLPFAALGEGFLVGEEAQESAPATVPGSAPTAAPAPATGDAAFDGAVRMLSVGSYLDALNAFAKLSGGEAARYGQYAQARLLLLRDDPAAALALLSELTGFLDTDYQLALCKATRLHRCMENGKFGFVDDTGAWLAAPQFDWAERVFCTQSAPQRDYRDAAFTTADTFTVAAVFAGSVTVTETDTQPETGLYGLLRSDGTLIAPTAFESVLWAKSGYAALAGAAGCHLLRIADGAEVGGPYEAVEPVAQGYIAAKQNGLWGYLAAATGEPVGEGFVWESAGPYAEGKAAVSKAGKYGYIDTVGKVVIPLAYTNAAPFADGLAGVRVAKRWGFIDAAGAEVIRPTYAAVGAFAHGVCAVKKGDAWGLIDRAGEVLLRIKYSEIGAFDPIYHRAWVRQNKLWGLVSTEGVLVLAPAWGQHDEFGGNTLCRVAYRGMYGFIDAGGKTRIMNTYHAASPFTAGYAAVTDESGAVAYINKTQRGFAIDTDVPVECRQGFIEARKLTVTQTPVLDVSGLPVTDKSGQPETVATYAIAYALYDAAGKAIPVVAYAAGGV
jgi:hypothetical protein